MLRPIRRRPRRDPDAQRESPEEPLGFVELPRPLVRVLELVQRLRRR